MRDKLNFGKNERVSIVIFENHIEISKSQSVCLFCKSEEDLIIYKNYKLCKSCIEEIGNQL